MSEFSKSEKQKRVLLYWARPFCRFVHIFYLWIFGRTSVRNCVIIWRPYLKKPFWVHFRGYRLIGLTFWLVSYSTTIVSFSYFRNCSKVPNIAWTSLVVSNTSFIIFESNSKTLITCHANVDIRCLEYRSYTVNLELPRTLMLPSHAYCMILKIHIPWTLIYRA